jgi:hypothetical protein
MLTIANISTYVSYRQHVEPSHAADAKLLKSEPTISITPGETFSKYVPIGADEPQAE